MSKKVRQAAEKFCNGHSCAQAVLTTYCDKYGLDREQAMKLTTGLAGGMGRMGNTCGTVTGSILVLGMEHSSGQPDDPDTKELTIEAIQEFSEKFEEKHKSLVCKELLDCDISTDEGYHTARTEQRFSRCPNFVETAVDILEDMMGESPEDS